MPGWWLHIHAGCLHTGVVAERAVRAADELVKPALTRWLAADEPPVEDGPLAALACALAATVDSMPPALRPTMLPQCSGQLVRVLGELEQRAARRRVRPAGPPSMLDQLRAARAASDAARMRR